jgi:hypothetical protein
MEASLVGNRSARVENADPVTSSSVWDGEGHSKWLVDRIRRLISDNSGAC